MISCRLCKLTSCRQPNKRQRRTAKVTRDWWCCVLQSHCDNQIRMILEWRFQSNILHMSMNLLICSVWAEVADESQMFFAAAQTCSPKWRATVQGWSMTLHKILFMALVAQELVTSKSHTLVLLYVLTWRSNNFLYLNKLNAGLYFSLAHITLCTWHIWTTIK